MQVRMMVAYNSINTFERAVNDFLKQIPEEKVVDIKYVTDLDVEKNVSRYTAMIIYKD